MGLFSKIEDSKKLVVPVINNKIITTAVIRDPKSTGYKIIYLTDTLTYQFLDKPTDFIVSESTGATIDYQNGYVRITGTGINPSFNFNRNGRTFLPMYYAVGINKYSQHSKVNAAFRIDLPGSSGENTTTSVIIGYLSEGGYYVNDPTKQYSNIKNIRIVLEFENGIYCWNAYLEKDNTDRTKIKLTNITVKSLLNYIDIILKQNIDVYLFGFIATYPSTDGVINILGKYFDK